MAEDFEMIDLSETDESMHSDVHRDKVYAAWMRMPFRNKVIFFIAAVLTFSLLTGIPAYGWMHWQRQIARFERISAPDSLYITAAHREDAKYFDIGGINVAGQWKNDYGTTVTLNGEPMYYKDFVFSVAGAYVPEYTLQLAYTTNNKFTYTIYEANGSKTKPAAGADGYVVAGRDYVEYKVTEDWPAELIVDISDNPAYAEVAEGDSLYYTKGTELTGTYLNRGESGLANWTKHELTYGTYDTGYVEGHAEPVYWQKTGITVANKAPFYHEYILRVSWNRSDTHVNKETDIVYITAEAD